MGTFVGRHPGRSVKENLADAEEVFRPVVDRAGERGVKVIIENCVMEGWPRVEAGLEVAHRTLRPLLVR